MEFCFKILLILFFINFVCNDDFEKPPNQSPNISITILPKLNNKSRGLAPLKTTNNTGKFFILAILLSNDVCQNPGPTTYPCGFCDNPVTWDHQRAICCDSCDIWYHSHCLECTNINISHLQNTNVSWICCKCNTPNINSFSFHSYDLESYNQFSVLSTSRNNSDFSIPSLDSTFSPTKHSSPKFQFPNSRSGSKSSNSKESTSSDDDVFPQTINPKNRNKLRVITINCQSIKNKLPLLQECLQYTKPDVISYYRL